MSKQSEAWEHYNRYGRYRDAERCHSLIWGHGYLSASRPLCAILDRVEWSAETDCDRHGRDVPMCPLCADRAPDGRAVGCELDAYLSEDRVRRQSWGEVPA